MSLAEGEMGDDDPSACHSASCPSSRTHTIPYKPPSSLLYTLMVKLHPGTTRLPSILRCLDVPSSTYPAAPLPVLIK
eukprot:scaffold54479_cov59-Attheya_sp.AAC.8